MDSNPPTVNSAPTPQGTGKKILIVDDEPSFCRILEKKLTGEGYQVLIAENGRIALDILSRTDVDLILLDLIMPEVDGITFVYNLKHSLMKNIPIIILTNLDQASHQPEIKDFLLKTNTSLEDIVKKVKQYTS